MNQTNAATTSATTVPKPKIIIVIDTEFESSNMMNGNFLQLGLVAILDDCELVNTTDTTDKPWLVDTLSVCFLEQEGKLKEKSAVQFWKKFRDVYQRIKDESGPPVEKMRDVQIWLNDLAESYEIVSFMADISCVDFTWFRNLYLTYCVNMKRDKFQMPYKALCQYSMEEALVLSGVSKDEIYDFYQSDHLPHTHYALDDAIKCAYEFLRLKLFIQTRKLKLSRET